MPRPRVTPSTRRARPFRCRGDRVIGSMAAPDPPADAEIVPLSGEIDVANADAIGDRLCETVDATPAGTRIVVDCGDVPFVDSRGLAMMLRVQRHADAAGHALTWSRLRDHPRSVLR